MWIAVSRQALLIAALPALLAGCGHVMVAPPPHGTLANVVLLPLNSGWFEGELVQYVSTDASDAAVAKALHVNHVARLGATLPARPTPGQPSPVERIYDFAGAQGNVLPSLPNPTGAANRDTSYSPLWRVVAVAWRPDRASRLLRSEEDVLAAAEQGEIVLTETSVIVNCPVVHSKVGGTLPGARLGWRADH